MEQLFDTVKELRQDVLRNIVHVLSSQEIFADLLENKQDAGSIANKMLNRITHKEDPNNFHYTTAITYPFITEPCMATRYSDGSFPVWYGSLDLITTIYETVHHMVRAEMQIQGIVQYQKIVRERVVYYVYCEGLLLDLTNKVSVFPDLIAENYHYTQPLGKKLQQQGYPGFLSTSARYHEGININILKQALLQNPRVHCKLTYEFFPETKEVKVFQDGHLLHII